MPENKAAQGDRAQSGEAAASVASKQRYEPPKIAWEEGIEEIGIYAGCGKDINCPGNPENAAS